MRLEAFFEKFDLFADAPNAVAKMRELVLQLAVTGQLVEQKIGDGLAADLLLSARSERDALVAARKIKARTSSPLEVDEQPFGIPANWQWARLSDVGFELGQKVPDRRFTYVDVGGIDSDKGRISERVEALEPNEAPSRARKLVAQGTVIYSTVRPYLLNIAIVDHEFKHEPIASTAFGILHPFTGINNRFLFYWLRSAPFTTYVQAGMKGMAYPAINDEKFYSGYIPLPPSTEQQRIVAKVDELMALCDRLEAQQQERDARHAALARASLTRFGEAPTPANLDFLFHKSYPITPADLRKAILSLAVQGKLVPQDPNDEPADAMLDRIVVTAKSRHRENGGSTDFDAPFEIPECWAWVKLPRVLKKLTDGTHHSPANGPSGDFMYVTAKNIKTDGVQMDGITFVSRELHDEIYSRCNPSFGDVLYIKDGATTGVATINQIKEPFSMLSSVALLKPSEAIFNRYLLWVMRSPFFYAETRGAMKGAAITRVTLSVMAASLLPLPPLAEQRRIVAKVDQLMAMVDRLEAQLAAAKTRSTALLNVVVHELLNPSAEIVDLAAYCAAIGCYAVRKMHDKPYFGRTAAMKLFYLAQAHVGLELDLRPLRDAAGPLDPWIYDFEREGAREDWFRVSEGNIANGKTKIAYQPGRMLGEQSALAERLLSASQRKEYDRLLSLFADRTTEEAEIIATLFAAWNDFLIDGHSPSDDQIVIEVREHWHEKKARFTPTVLRQWLAWLRQNNLLPTGRPPHTVHQPQLLLN